MAEQLMILGRVIVAMLLGAAVGLEREVKDKPAGLRTHMLVTGTAALLVALGPLLADRSATDPAFVNLDPIRLVQAIVMGVGFLGAGTIMREPSGAVHGLTTAASIFYCAAVGITVGLSEWLLGAALTLLGVGTLRGIAILERRWLRQPPHS